MKRGAAVVAVGAIALAGCGGSSLSERQLRNDATQICRTAQLRMGRIGVPASPSGGRAFLRHGVAVLTPELAQLRRLRPPSSMADDYRKALADFTLKLGTLRATLVTLKSGGDPVAGFQSLQQALAPIEAREDDSWGGLDIAACVNR
jgi:hypothetical protein